MSSRASDARAAESPAELLDALPVEVPVPRLLSEWQRWIDTGCRCVEAVDYLHYLELRDHLGIAVARSAGPLRLWLVATLDELDEKFLELTERDVEGLLWADGELDVSAWWRRRLPTEATLVKALRAEVAARQG